MRRPRRFVRAGDEHVGRVPRTEDVAGRRADDEVRGEVWVEHTAARAVSWREVEAGAAAVVDLPNRRVRALHV